MEGLSIIVKKAVAHEVIRASDFSKGVVPEYSDQLIPMNEPRLKKLLETRLATVLGSGSHSIEMDVNDNSKQSCFQQMASLSSASADDYIAVTKASADQLTKSQISGSVKAGVAFFISGVAFKTDSNKEHFFTCVIKADADQALVKEKGEDGKISFKFIADMLLSNHQRLLKVGFFMQNESCELGEDKLYPVDSYSVLVFDHLISENNPSKGAVYFYDHFLGCKPVQSAKYLTRDFFDKTVETIGAMNLTDAEKVDQRNNLNAYMRSNKGTVSTLDFASSWLPKKERKSYVEKMSDKGVNENSIQKDTSLIKNKMRKRTLKFHNNIKIVAEVEDLNNFVKLGAIEEGWTNVKIKGELKSQS